MEIVFETTNGQPLDWRSFVILGGMLISCVCVPLIVTLVMSKFE